MPWQTSRHRPEATFDRCGDLRERPVRKLVSIPALSPPPSGTSAARRIQHEGWRREGQIIDLSARAWAQCKGSNSRMAVEGALCPEEV